MPRRPSIRPWRWIKPVGRIPRCRMTACDASLCTSVNATIGVPGSWISAHSVPLDQPQSRSHDR